MTLPVSNLEIRYNANGTLDEVVADHPKHFHLEQMSNWHWWMRIEMENGEAVTVDLATSSKSRAHVKQSWRGDKGRKPSGGGTVMNRDG